MKCAWVPAVTLLLLLCGCSDGVPGGLRIGIAHPPVNLDPRFATDASSDRIGRLLYDRLVEFDEHYRAVPGIADWVSITPSHYRFSLRADRRRYSNGEPVSAEDVCATYADVLDPTLSSPHGGGLAVIARVSCDGPDTVDFHLHRDDALFPGRLVIGILPAELIAAGHSFDRQPVGSGPFKFVARASEGRLLLERRSDGLPIEFHVAANATVRVLKLIRGELDIVQGDLTPELNRWLQKRADIELIHKVGSTMSYIGMNLEDPVLSQRPVRMAIALSLDRIAIIEKLMTGMTRPANSILPPEHWASDPGLSQITTNRQRARELLESAGYNSERPLRLTYKTSNDRLRVRLATVLQSQLAATGIAVEIASHDWGTFYADVKAGRFQMYGLSWVGLKMPDIFRYAFHSGAVPPYGANRGRYRSDEFDRLLASAETAADAAEQASLYRVVQRRLLDDLPYIPLWFEDQVAAVRPTVAGYTVGSDGGYDGLTSVQWKVTGSTQ